MVHQAAKSQCFQLYLQLTPQLGRIAETAESHRVSHMQLTSMSACLFHLIGKTFRKKFETAKWTLRTLTGGAAATTPRHPTTFLTACPKCLVAQGLFSVDRSCPTFPATEITSKRQDTAMAFSPDTSGSTSSKERHNAIFTYQNLAAGFSSSGSRSMVVIKEILQ
ncbi:hypothetical protein N656DRAFT_576685 [Canariomyces notabilis]|uniref:Uncharacterized protein n=1 Tax=Canariomyces notabilis TaxID=2074819 RepID=A0AAN6TGU2_9PEZI|nr:hypothetical protein N656DRAFT_576685 [Canariomyces arenarius]